MVRWGVRRPSDARHRSDAGNTTGVATAVLALLSAGALASLGLLSAGEITDGLGRGVGLGPDGVRVDRPGEVVVNGSSSGESGGSGGSRGSGDSGGSGTTGGAGGGRRGPASADISVPGPGGAVLPSPAGVASSPDAEPIPGVAGQPADPSLPTSAAPTPTTFRFSDGPGRSAAAPGHNGDARGNGDGSEQTGSSGKGGTSQTLATAEEGSDGSSGGGSTGSTDPSPLTVREPRPIPTPVTALMTGTTDKGGHGTGKGGQSGKSGKGGDTGSGGQTAKGGQTDEHGPAATPPGQADTTPGQGKVPVRGGAPVRP
jgi:hypothetical protein